MTDRLKKSRYVLTLVVVWLLIIVFFSVISYFGAASERADVNFNSILRNNFFRFGLWGLLFHFIFGFIQKLESQKRSFLYNFFIHSIYALVFSTLHFTGFASLSWLSSPETSKTYPNIWGYIQAYYWGNLTFGLIVYAIIALTSQAYIRNKKFAEQEKKSALLQSQLTQAQLQALKMQLQPHFLFNTLNSISSLVVKNPFQAQTMIAKLGDFLRMTLDFDESQMVLLREELQFLRSYLDIEQVRFSEKLQVVFDIEDEALSGVVPHLALQPIVENCVKHGISPMTEGGKIEISGRKIGNKLCVEVKDNGGNFVFDSAQKKRNRTGLANVRARLEHIYGKNYGFEIKSKPDEETTVSIIVPFTTEFSNAEKNERNLDTNSDN